MIQLDVGFQTAQVVNLEKLILKLEFISRIFELLNRSMNKHGLIRVFTEPLCHKQP